MFAHGFFAAEYFANGYFGQSVAGGVTPPATTEDSRRRRWIGGTA